MKNIKHFIAGALTTAIIFSCGISALATSGVITLQVTPAKVIVNNQEFKPFDVKGNRALVFNYNGTVYAPLRGIASAYGLDISWDQQKQMVRVDDGRYSEPTPTIISTPKFSQMSYDEFRSMLIILKENGTIKHSEDDGNPIIYHIHLGFESQYNESELKIAWDDFMEGNGKEYLTTLYYEYFDTMPYNMVAIHIHSYNMSTPYLFEYSSKLIQMWHEGQ